MNVIDRIGEPAGLEQLAEEASELAHAALKMARVLRNENPTPVSREKASANLIEEFSDVLLVAGELGLEADREIMAKKLDRWKCRVSPPGEWSYAHRPLKECIINIHI